MRDRVRPNDFVETDRPINRRAQCWDLLRHRFLDLLKISFLYAIFLMPLFVSIVIFWPLLRNAAASGDINQIATVFVIQGASLLISIPVAFIGLTGSYRCLKQLVFAEDGFASSSFFYGLKDGWKQGFIIGLLPGLSATLAFVGGFFLYVKMGPIDKWVTGFGLAILAIQFIVVLIISYYSISQTQIYDNKIRFVLKNSFIFSLIKSPSNLLIFILYPGIFIACISIFEISMFVGLVLTFFFSAFGHLFWILNTVEAFDRFINKENHPEIYRRGLQNIDLSKEE